MHEANVSFVGNIGAEPVLRYTDSEKAVLNFRVAVNQVKKSGDEYKDTNTTWYEVTLWEGQAERAVELLKQGSRVFVEGRLIAEQYENKKGEKGIALKVEPTALGLDLMARTKKSDSQEPTDDPWLVR